MVGEWDLGGSGLHLDLDPTDSRNNSLEGAIHLGLLTDNGVNHHDRVGADDHRDYYRLSLDHASRLSLNLEGLDPCSPSATIALFDGTGIALDGSKIRRRGSSTEVDLERGDYYFSITYQPTDGAIDYHLKACAKSIAEWSMLVYMAADNNLEAYGIQDFLEMAEVGSSRDVTIALTFDRAAGYSTDYGNWTTTKRGLVQKGDRPTATWGQDLGEHNMGNSRTLSEFIKWGMEAAPAIRYQLVLWNHGGGWNQIATDEGNFHDYLSANEISTALTPIPKLDIIGADACYMGMVEFAYQLRSEANYFVGSAAAEPVEGWDYSHLLQQINRNPTASARSVAETIVTSYGHQITKSSAVAYGLSAIDLAQMDRLNQSLSQLVDHLITATPLAAPLGTSLGPSPSTTTIVNALTIARDRSLAFGLTSQDYRDLGQLLQTLSDNPTLSNSQRSAARETQSIYRQAIVATVSQKGASGLSIYMPWAGATSDGRYNAGNQQMAANGRWDELLRWWSPKAKGQGSRSTSPYTWVSRSLPSSPLNPTQDRANYRAN